MESAIRVLIYLCVAWHVSGLHTTKHLIDLDHSGVADTGNYSCDALLRWLGTEKHYSNDRNKQVLFSLLPQGGDAQRYCRQLKHPVLLLNDVHFGRSSKGKGNVASYFKSDSATCSTKNEYVVAYLSNFSINNNFSHFLHGLLRLFCALIDARWIVWNDNKKKFEKVVPYTIWLDEWFKLNTNKMAWLKALTGGEEPVHLGRSVKSGSCMTAKTLIYGSGCVKLLPPEKWFGYPHCRAGEVLPAFGQYMRQQFAGKDSKDLFLIDEFENNAVRSVYRSTAKDDKIDGVRVAFAVRDVTELTGKRGIDNLRDTQVLLRRTQHVKTKTENITFEHLDVPSTVRYMSNVHIFVSVHGAGMTNMFFMNPGSAVVEIIPYPLCECRSPDYFYGVGGYYHGSAIAQNIRHYPYCVDSTDTHWHKKPERMGKGHKCSWKYLHSVESVTLDATKFVSLMRSVERDLVQAGTVILTKPIINMSPHANG